MLIQNNSSTRTYTIGGVTIDPGKQATVSDEYYDDIQGITDLQLIGVPPVNTAAMTRRTTQTLFNSDGTLYGVVAADGTVTVTGKINPFVVSAGQNYSFAMKEGDVLTLYGDATAAGVLTRIGYPNTNVGSGQIKFGPYSGSQTMNLSTSAGNINASVSNGAPIVKELMLQRFRNLDRVGQYPMPIAAASIATVTGDWSGANAPVAVAAGAVSAEQILPCGAMLPGDIPVTPTPPSALASGLTVHTYRYVTPTTIGIRFRNTSGSTLTPPAGIWTINLARFTGGVPADAPHVTLSAAGAASQIGASGVIQTILGDSGKIRMRHPVLRDGGYGGTYVYPTQNTHLSGVRTGSICAADWVTDAPKFELLFVGNRSNVQIYVDGKCVTPAPINLAIDFGVGYRVLVDFTQGGTLTTGVRKQRKIRMEMRANGSYALFGGVTLLKSDSIMPPSSANPVRGVVFGDSFIEGKDPLHPLAQISCPNDGFANRIGDLLGWDECIVCGVGGTGYLSDTTGTAKKYGDRINDIISLNPDIVVVFGSINDAAPYTPANTQAAVTAFYAQLVAALPNALIIVFGVQKVGDSSSSLATLNTAVINGVNAVGASNLFAIDMFSPAWVGGTGKSTAQTNDGNADWVTGSDGVHPTWEGHNFYTYKIAEAIRNIISSQLKRN